MYKVHPDRGNVDVRVVAIRETNKKGRFAASAVPHDDYLEQVIASPKEKKTKKEMRIEPTLPPPGGAKQARPHAQFLALIVGHAPLIRQPRRVRLEKESVRDMFCLGLPAGRGSDRGKKKSKTRICAGFFNGNVVCRAVPNSTIGGQTNTTFLFLNCGIRGRW